MLLNESPIVFNGNNNADGESGGKVPVGLQQRQ